MEGESPEPSKTFSHSFPRNITPAARVVCEIRATNIGILRKLCRRGQTYLDEASPRIQLQIEHLKRLCTRGIVKAAIEGGATPRPLLRQPRG